MTMCEALSDRMPAVAGGRDAWSVEEQAHLASCSDCSAEWKVVATASGLGRSVIVDPQRLAPELLGRLREARRQDRRKVWVRRSAPVVGLAIAAAALLVVLPRGREQGPAAPLPAAAALEAGPLQLAELEGATTADLVVVLASFDEPAVPRSALDGPNVEGMDLIQVQRALESWEES